MALRKPTSWTPLQGGDSESGDVGWEYITSQEETAYDGASTTSHSYEMNDISDPHAYHSSTSLLQAQKFSRDSSEGPSGVAGFLRQHHLSGWKVGVLSCSAIAAVVCLLNIVLTTWAVINHKIADGLSFLYTGSCKEVANMSLWIHLAINAMSTLLLSASNYTMQIISSPTRKEVDVAHQKFRWLDIGVPSTRNLREISWGRICMWAILVLSSLPLHLMYNSAIFSSLAANSYEIIVVAEAFMAPEANFSSSTTVGVSSDMLEAMHDKALNGTLIRYDSAACMELYSSTFVNKFRNVLLVSTDKSAINTVLTSKSWTKEHSIPYYWICGDGYIPNPYEDDLPVCRLSLAQAAAASWTLASHSISYCMVEPTEERCRLSFSVAIMVVVIISNIAKVVVMLLTFWKLKEPPLVTVGDAVASFLDKPDPSTVGICLSTKHSIVNREWRDQVPKMWAPKRHFWFKAASTKRWLTCNFLCILTICLGIWFYLQGMDNLGIYDIKSLYEMGFGTANPNSLVGVAPPGLISTVLFANMPQAILSFLYLSYNALYSCVLGAHEWSLFAGSRRTLRVTSPAGKQRSTYYLQLPYPYAIPLLMLSGVLHWLMSQSLFLAYVDVFKQDGKLDQYNSISTVGYSCIAIFFSIIVGVVAVVAGIVNGFRRYNAEIPLVGSCSAAISAACHQPKEDPTASLLPVQWGVVEADSNDGIGHCCLTSFEVTRPVEGNFYAGHVKED